MAGLNKIVIVGNLTADPEMRFTVDGSAVTKYRLAVNRPKRSDGADSGVDFVPVVCFNRLGEIAGEYLKKGRKVLVEGRIQVRSYTTAEGVTKWSTEVVASNMVILDKGDRSGGADGDAAPEAPEMEVSAGGEPMYDDIPF